MSFSVNQKRKVDFRWVMVGVCFTNLALLYSIWYSFPVFFVALLKEFGWSRSMVAGAFSSFILVHHFMGPFAGRMVERLGPRRTVWVGCFMLSAGLLLLSLTRTAWHFYVFYGVVTAVGLGSTGWVANTAIIQAWFEEKRGLPLGIVSSGVGMSMLVCVPLITSLIHHSGWREAYRIMGVMIPGLVALMALLFFRNTPKSLAPPPPRPVSETSHPSSQEVEGARGSEDWTIQKAWVTRSFWLLGFSFFLGSWASQSILAHHVAFFVDQGQQALFASYLIGVIGIVSVGGKIFWGTLSDRIGREITYTLGTAAGVGSMLCLLGFLIQGSPGPAYAYAVLFGLGYAITGAMPPIVTGDFFGGRSYGRIFGTLFIFSGLGGSMGAWFAGIVYDHWESYLLVFGLVALFFVVTSLLIWKAAPRNIGRSGEN